MSDDSPQTSPTTAHFDAFLTHDWGKDELGRDNHQRVVDIARRLTAAGLRVWLDQDYMVGDVVAQMIDGINKSDCVVVFVTRRYHDKVHPTLP